MPERVKKNVVKKDKRIQQNISMFSLFEILLHFVYSCIIYFIVSRLGCLKARIIYTA